MSYDYGIYSGTTDMYYATMSGTDAVGTKPTYAKPKLLGKSVNFTVTPTYKEGEKYASNSAVRREKRLNTYEVSIACDAIKTVDMAAILGHTIGTDNVQIFKGTDTAPYIALGFGITKDDGSKELWWMYKGKMARDEISAETETGDIAYQDTELTGVFDRRICDDAICAVTDTADSNITESTWFGDVFERAASA